MVSYHGSHAYLERRELPLLTGQGKEIRRGFGKVGAAIMPHT